MTLIRMLQIFEEEKKREPSQAEFFRMASPEGYKSFGNMSEDEWRKIVRRHYHERCFQ
jgi:hypothetical protein